MVAIESMLHVQALQTSFVYAIAMTEKQTCIVNLACSIR